MLAGQRDKYFGVQARLEFGDMFRDALNELIHCPDDDDLPTDRKTPRTMYLREVTKNNMLPLPLVMITHLSIIRLIELYNQSTS